MEIIKIAIDCDKIQQNEIINYIIMSNHSNVVVLYSVQTYFMICMLFHPNYV